MPSKTNLKQLIPPEEIRIVVERLAREVRTRYADKDPLLICVLKGSFMFFADLVRLLKMPFEIDFMQAQCYGTGHTPRREVGIYMEPSHDISGRHVIVVEDIIDRGVTALEIMEYLKEKNPASIALMTLLVREGTPVKPDFAGIKVDKGFVAGYGMDYKEHYRALPGIYVVEDS